MQTGTDDALALIGTYAQQVMSATHELGLSVAVTDRAHTIKIYSLGIADVQSCTPVTKQRASEPARSANR